MDFTVLTFVMFLSGSCCGLQLRSYKIPSFVDIHNEAVLSCDFDAELDLIDTYRWSVNGTVFYSQSPAGTFINHVNGIYVRLEESAGNRVVLFPVDLATSGVYRCEASTKSSTPNSLAIQKTMNVIAYPREGPSIQGVHGNHTWGHLVELNCTSAPSFPPAHIVWTVRNLPVKDDQLVTYPDEDVDDPIRSSKAGVRLQTDQLPFGPSGEVSISCVALVPGIYRSLVTLTLQKAQVRSG